MVTTLADVQSYQETTQNHIAVHNVAVSLQTLCESLLSCAESDTPLDDARHMLYSWEETIGDGGVLDGMSETIVPTWRRRISSMYILLYDKGVGHDLGIHRPFDSDVGVALKAVADNIAATVTAMLEELEK